MKRTSYGLVFWALFLVACDLPGTVPNCAPLSADAGFRVQCLPNPPDLVELTSEQQAELSRFQKRVLTLEEVSTLYLNQAPDSECRVVVGVNTEQDKAFVKAIIGAEFPHLPFTFCTEIFTESL